MNHRFGFLLLVSGTHANTVMLSYQLALLVLSLGSHAVMCLLADVLACTQRSVVVTALALWQVEIKLCMQT